MAGKTVIKPYKLKPSGDSLTRDDLSTWKQILLGHIRQNATWHQFLPSSATYKEWVCTDDDETNALEGADATATNALRATFQDFLTCVATYAPAGFTDTIIRESTSFNWIIDLIKTTFALETKGENFLALDDMKFEFDGNFTYQQGYMEVKDFVCASLVKKGNPFEGKPAPANEILSPSTKNFIVKEFLSKVDPRLPKHVKDTRGHLFTTERPTLACNQKILCDQIPTMLAELEKKDHTSLGNVNVGYVPAYRGRGMGGVTPRANYLGRVPFRGGPSRFPPPSRGQPQTMTSGGCIRCLEATPRRYDAAKTHVVKDCPWPRPPQQQQATRQPNFRVVMFPESQAVQQPQIATVAMGQQNQAPTYNYQGAEYYTHDYHNDQYYLPQEEYTGATISELPQQDL
jgi:hypothetical protein